MEFSSSVILYQFNNKIQEKYRAVCFFSPVDQMMADKVTISNLLGVYYQGR